MSVGVTLSARKTNIQIVAKNIQVVRVEDNCVYWHTHLVFFHLF